MTAMETDFEFATRMVRQAERSGDIQLKALAVRAVSSNAPTTEIGLMRPDYGYKSTKDPFGVGWNQWVDLDEYVPELKWPQSNDVFNRMRTDAQISGLMRAMTYPIRRFKWLLDPNGARPIAVEKIAADFNLDIVGQDPMPRRRRKNRFSFDKFLYHALLALYYGHMFFEISGVIDPDMMWRLTKLVPRMPKTISMINVAPDGGLISIRQNLQRYGGAYTPGGMGPEITVDRLVAFPWEMEGADWTGRSMLRDCYKNWLIKDRLLRIDAINHEKAGGIHVATAPPGATPAEMDRLAAMAQAASVAEGSGGAVPQGASYDIKRAGGGTDVIGSIKYHDESMARLFLHMFIQLGQTETGSRALGLSFIEYAFIAQKAVASWFVDIVNEHVIEDWMDYNYADDEEQAPLLTYVLEEEDEHLAVTELVELVGAGIITPDPELENELRSRYHLPEQEIPSTLSGVALEAAKKEHLWMLAKSDVKNGLRSRKPVALRADGRRARVRRVRQRA